MKTVPLWPNGAPGALGTEPRDIPTLTFVSDYQPTKKRSLFIVCPGGGYGGLADYEGAPVAQWFETLGLCGAVLTYRLGPRYHHPIELGDVQRAVRYARANADTLGIDPKRVGVLGFSAGGHLAATVATHWDHGIVNAADPVDQFSCRPDASMLIYPVIRMSDPYGHVGSRENLLGKHPEPNTVRSLDNDEVVSLETPPTFLFHGADDSVVPVQNSLLYAKALADHRIPFSLHVPNHGQHGFGLGTPESEQDWRSAGERFLRAHGF